jgi:hypothetical protein
MTSVPSQSPRRTPIAGALTSFLLCFSFGAHAQVEEAEPWREAEVTPPAAFSIDQLQTFEVMQGSSLSYGIDPKTLSVGEDGVVRYVLVARSTSGALNVLYQGIRCQTGEAKTYGRWDNQSSWNTGRSDDWQQLSFKGPTRPAMMLARAGICEGRTITGNPQKILNTLKKGRPDETR